MYARSTRIPANTSSIDAGIAYVRDEVRPKLAQLDGFIGLSMMVDRSSGMCITTSAWRDAEAMRITKSRVQTMRDRAAEILGGSPMVEEWEVAVMHRDHPAQDGACVRAAWLRTDVGRLDEAIDIYRMVALPKIEELDGFCSASFMVDRNTGRAVSSACFESRAALDASREAGNQIRAAGTKEAGAMVVEVLEFELVVARLRVPEMV